MESVFKDVLHGIRSLLKRPGFSAIIVLTLAVGIGANTAVFSVVNATLFRRLPFREPQQLVTLWEKNPERGYEQNPPAAGNYVDWRDQNRVFAHMAAYAPSRQFNVSTGDQAERYAGATVSASLFEVLGVGALKGRVFNSNDETPGNNQVVLISYNFWRKKLPGVSDPQGKSIIVDGKPCTIVGVMPEGFQFPGGSGTVLRIFTPAAADLWTPLTLDAHEIEQRSSHYLNVIARLKPGTTPAQATAEMDAIQQRIAQLYPTFYVGSNVKLVPLDEQVIGTVRRPVLILWGAVGFVLLISCANVANLMLVHATSRKREIAVRTALGATRSRLVRLLLTESLLLSLAGGTAGILLAMWFVRAFATIVPQTFPRHEEIRVDTVVLMFTFLTSVVTGLAFGLAPALQSLKVDLTHALKAGGRTVAEGGRSLRLRNLLVTAQLSLTLMLLIGAALMVQSFMRLGHVSPGFNPDRLLTMAVSLPLDNYPRARRPLVFQQLIQRTQTLPGVVSVAAAKHLPLSGDNMNFAFDIEKRPFPQGESPGADCRIVTSDYFTTLGIPLIKGRFFKESDTVDAPHVLLINEAMARTFFPNEDPIGQRLQLGINNFSGQIVGVVGDVKHVGLDAPTNHEVYISFSQAPFSTDMTLIARTSGDPMTIVGAVRNEIKGLDSQVAVGKVRTMEEITKESIGDARFRTLLLSIFGAVALVLAAVGVYGVISYSVTQRTHEIGIRMALGAQIADVRKLVISSGMKLALIGTVVGVVGAYALTRLLTNLLFGLAPTDPPTFVIVSFVLLLVALTACYIPARRAAKVDPLVALRYE
jgi:putative ABC transport system permease protein